MGEADRYYAALRTGSLPKALGIRKSERMRKKVVWWSTIAIWLATFAVFAVRDVSFSMKQVWITPEPDSYANTLGYQIIAFMLTKGMAAVVLLIVILQVESILLKKRG